MNDKRMLKLVKIKNALKKHLPSSIQLYNIIVCEISQDGIERRVFVNEDLDEDNIAVVVINKLECPKNIISMYCTDNCTEQLRILIKENVSWGANNEFEVKRKFPNFVTELDIYSKELFYFQYLQGMNDVHIGMLRGFVDESIHNNWQITVCFKL